MSTSAPGEIICGAIMGVEDKAAYSHRRAMRHCIERLAKHLVGLEGSNGIVLTAKVCADLELHFNRGQALLLTRPKHET